MRGVRDTVRVGRGIQHATQADSNEGSGMLFILGVIVAVVVIFIVLSYVINKRENRR